MLVKNTRNEICPCGSGRSYAQCCLPYIKGDRPAPTAEALMRSRYCAYVNDEVEYLLASWHASTRPESLDVAHTQPDKWLGLKIVNTQAGTINDTQGAVEFIARYKQQGRAYRLHEVSRFVKQDDRWFYLDGELRE